MSFFRVFCALFACLLTFAPSASGQDLSSTASELGSLATAVVTGRVSAVTSGWSDGTIYEYVTIAVSERLKGPALPASIVIKQLGGRVDGLGLRIEEQASFTPGESVLLFLGVRPRDGTLATVQLGRGKWVVLPDLGTGRLRALPGTGGAGTRAAPAAGTPGLDLDAVRAIVASTPDRAEAFVAAPQETLRAAPAFAYLPTDDGIPARWHQADEGQDVPVDFMPPQGSTPGGQAQLASALARWNNAGAHLQLSLGSSGAVCSAFDFRGDRRIRVYFDDPCGDAGIVDLGVFGAGGGYYTPGDRRTINGTEFQAFIQGFVVLKNSGTHLTSAACLEDALTHTIGHTIGLGDSGTSGAIMNASVLNGCGGSASSLAQDDVNGVRAIYPGIASGPDPPQAPVAFTATVALNTVTLDWTPATTGGPAQSYIIEAGNFPGAANIATFVVNAPQTHVVVGGVLPGRYFVRVKASNIIGTSGPSPEAQVDVLDCQLPGAPQNLSSTVNDQLVNLSWAPPASGGPISNYTLAAGSTPGAANILTLPLGATTTFSTSGVPYGNYYVRLYAQNACGAGPATSDVLVSVQPCQAPPSQPVLTHRQTPVQGGYLVTLEWTLPPGGGAPTRYWVGAGDTSNNYNILVQPTADLTPSFSAVAPTGTYFVRVAAENACGLSVLSDEIKIDIQ